MSIDKSNGQQAQAHLLQDRAYELAEVLTEAIKIKNTNDRQFGI